MVIGMVICRDMLDKILHFQGDILFLFARNYSFSNSAPPFTIEELQIWEKEVIKQLKIKKQNKKGCIYGLFYLREN